MSDKVKKIAEPAGGLLKLIGSVALIVLWSCFIVIPQLRAFSLVRWTKPVEYTIDEAAAKKPPSMYISLTGTFRPRQARRIVETGERAESVMPEKDKRHLFPLCSDDESACIYYGTDDLSWEPPADIKITINGIVKDFSKKESMQMTLLHAKDISDFNIKHPVRYRLKKDGTPDWDHILSEYAQRNDNADRTLPTVNSWYFHDEHDYNQPSFMVFLLIATSGVLLIAGGLFISAKETLQKHWIQDYNEQDAPS